MHGKCPFHGRSYKVIGLLLIKELKKIWHVPHQPIHRPIKRWNGPPHAGIARPFPGRMPEIEMNAALSGREAYRTREPGRKYRPGSLLSQVRRSGRPGGG